MSALAVGTTGQVYSTNGAAANPSWINSLGSVLDYGSSASASTSRQGTTLKIAYGLISIGAGSSQAITNLAFTSSSTYTVCVTYNTTSGAITQNCSVVNNSGSQCTVYNPDGSTRVMSWIAVGI